MVLRLRRTDKVSRILVPGEYTVELVLELLDSEILALGDTASFDITLDSAIASSVELQRFTHLNTVIQTTTLVPTASDLYDGNILANRSIVGPVEIVLGNLFLVLRDPNTYEFTIENPSGFLAGEALSGVSVAISDQKLGNVGILQVNCTGYDSRFLSGMEYQFDVGPIRDRLLNELRHEFAQRPRYKELAEYISTYFPFKERPQYGIIAKDISVNPQRLSPQNFMGRAHSHVTLMRESTPHGAPPGQFISWVKENTRNLYRQECREDVSGQVDGFVNEFQLANTRISDPETGKALTLQPGETAISFIAMNAFVNDEPILIREVNAKLGTIVLDRPPPLGSRVDVTYWWKDLVPPGWYRITLQNVEEQTERALVNQDLPKFRNPVNAEAFLEEFLEVKEEVIVEEFDSTGTLTFSLAHERIIAGSEELFRDDYIPLVRDYHYTIDETLGEVTIDPSRVPDEARIFTDYFYHGESRTINWVPGTGNENILPGIIFAFSDDLIIDDSVLIRVTEERDIVALQYGGRHDISVTLDILALDDVYLESITKITHTLFDAKRKPALDEDGINLRKISYATATEPYVTATNEQYFKAVVSMEYETDWMFQVPLPVAIRRLDNQLRTDFAELTDDQIIDGEERLTTQVVESLPEFLPDTSPNLERLK